MRDRATTTRAEGCVFTRGAARRVAAGGLPLQPTVYVHSGDRPPSADINSGKRNTTAMRECSPTVNISLAVSCPPCQRSLARSLSPIPPPPLSPPLQSCRPGRCVSLSRRRCSPSARSPAAPVRLCWQKATRGRKKHAECERRK